MRSMIRPDLLDLPGYTPITPTDVLAERLGIRPEDVIKLDGNENPFGPSPKALAAIAGERAYHIYPDPDQHRVREALSRFLEVEPERIVCGLGSDDLIDLILRAVVLPAAGSPGSRDGVVNCPPTFGMYPFSTEIAGGRVIDVPRQESFALDVAGIEKAAPGAKLIFVASPNNPTGNRLSPAELERLLATGLIVVVDEAYIDFADAPDAASALTMRSLRERLVVLRTFSKAYGLAALRVGYAVAPRGMVDYLNRVRAPFNVNGLAQVAARAALEDGAYVAKYVAMNRVERTRLSAELEALGYRVAPSQANFVLVEAKQLARELYDRLLRRGVIVRPMPPPIDAFLRITIGLPEENDRLLAVLRETT